MPASLRPAIPSLQGRQRIERLPAVVPAQSAPQLEVEVATPGVAAVADGTDRLPRVNAVALAEGGRLVEVHVDVVDVRAVAIDHDVVARRRVVLLELDAATAGGHHARAALGHHVLALVAVPRAARAEVRAGTAEVVASADGEDVVVEVERVTVHVARLSALGLGAVGARGCEAERVAARLCGGAPEAAVPGDALDLVRRYLLRGPRLHRHAVAGAHQLDLESGGGSAREPEGEGHARPGAHEGLGAARGGLQARG